MEEKKITKMSLSSFFLIIAIIAICVMGFFIYKLNDDKIKATEQVSKLSNRVELLESDKNETKETIIEKTNTNTEMAKNNSESIVNNTKNTYFYKDIKGIYECSKNYSDVSSSYKLTLYENGTFKYLIAFEYPTTLIGNYIIVDDEIRLNEIFVMGGSAGLSATSQTLTLKINSDGTIGDTNHFSKDDKNFENIKLEKKQNNTNDPEDAINVNDLIKSMPLFNDYKE